MLKCLTSARMSMKFTLLHQGQENPGDINVDEYGTWVEQQDPLTGEIVHVWQPYDDPNVNDDVVVTVNTYPCIARGVVDGGIRVAGTTEWFGQTYENMEFVKLWTPVGVKVNKRDRITNITDAQGHIRWVDEESANNPLKATVYNVNGVTPLFNAFNRATEWFCLLERAEVST